MSGSQPVIAAASYCKAIFVDKDGTLIVNVPYNVSLSKIAFTEGMLEELRLLQEAGYLIIIASNQSGIARGYFTERQMKKVMTHITRLMKNSGVILSGFYYCPHHPQGMIHPYALTCACRKPLPGLLNLAAHEMHIDLKNSWMIGDSMLDVEAGAAAGCATVLLESGGANDNMPLVIEPTIKISNVVKLSSSILNHDKIKMTA